MTNLININFNSERPTVDGRDFSSFQSESMEASCSKVYSSLYQQVRSSFFNLLNVKIILPNMVKGFEV